LLPLDDCLYVHIGIAEVRSKEGKLYLFVAIDRTSKFVLVYVYCGSACKKDPLAG
jgi:hypothetical protein